MLKIQFFYRFFGSQNTAISIDFSSQNTAISTNFCTVIMVNSKTQMHLNLSMCSKDYLPDANSCRNSPHLGCLPLSGKHTIIFKLVTCNPFTLLHRVSKTLKIILISKIDYRSYGVYYIKSSWIL